MSVVNQFKTPGYRLCTKLTHICHFCPNSSICLLLRDRNFPEGSQYPFETYCKNDFSLSFSTCPQNTDAVLERLVDHFFQLHRNDVEEVNRP